VVGEAAEEESAVGCPYESFGDDRVAFIVDLESAVIHEPGPGSFNDPALWERNEFVWMDPVDDFGVDTTPTAVLNEALLETGIAPQFREPPGLGSSGIEHFDPTLVV
jgi:hypothetical protein